LTLPDPLPIPLSPARAFALSLVLSLLLAAQPSSAPTLMKKLPPAPFHLTYKLQPVSLTAAIHPSCTPTNFETSKQIP
jgi:hypothetical protein